MRYRNQDHSAVSMSAGNAGLHCFLALTSSQIEWPALLTPAVSATLDIPVSPARVHCRHVFQSWKTIHWNSWPAGERMYSGIERARNPLHNRQPTANLVSIARQMGIR